MICLYENASEYIQGIGVCGSETGSTASCFSSFDRLDPCDGAFRAVRRCCRSSSGRRARAVAGHPPRGAAGVGGHRRRDCRRPNAPLARRCAASKVLRELFQHGFFFHGTQSALHGTGGLGGPGSGGGPTAAPSAGGVWYVEAERSCERGHREKPRTDEPVPRRISRRVRRGSFVQPGLCGPGWRSPGEDARAVAHIVGRDRSRVEISEPRQPVPLCRRESGQVLFPPGGASDLERRR